MSVLNLLYDESNELKAQPAIAFYKFPQVFFKEVASDNQLFLKIQHRAIKAQVAVNQQFFNKPYQSLIATVLSCIFQEEITSKDVHGVMQKAKFSSL